MQTQPISVKYLRENFTRVKEGLKNGLPYLLIYRSEPIAEITPWVKKKKSNRVMQTLFDPPRKLCFQSKISSVDLIRQERD